MKKFLLATAILGNIACSSAQTFEAELDNIRSNNNLVGMAVGVACGENTLATYYGGLAKINPAAPIDSSTLFRIASISKTFSAVGLMRLFDQGLFDLDDDVSEALGYTLRNPAFPDQAISYRMVLSHQSSLQDGDGYNPFLNATFGTGAIPDMAELFLPSGAYFTPNMWRTELPGTYFAYSNINYGLIGTLIEKLSNTRFDIYMKTNVLNPLNVTGGFNVATLENIVNVAVLYRNSAPQQDNYNGINPAPLVDGSYVPGTNGLIYGPQGGLRTNLSGLMRLGQMLANQGVSDGSAFLSLAVVAEMLSDQWTFNGENGDNYYGLFNSWGLGIHRALDQNTADEVIDNVLMHGHPGEAYGLISDLYFNPENRFVLAFMTNGYSSGGNYSFGANSSFYAPEEESFNAIESEFWASCQTVSTVENTQSKICAGITYLSTRGTLLLSENWQTAQVECYTPNGQLSDLLFPAGSRVEIPKTNSIQLIRVIGPAGSCTKKIFAIK